MKLVNKNIWVCDNCGECTTDPKTFNQADREDGDYCMKCRPRRMIIPKETQMASEPKEHLFVPYSELQEGDELTDAFTIAKSYYLKSDADKVIAEKDKEIQRLENLCESYRIDCDNLAIREANACKEIERDNKQIRHQKYKRCLAMAQVLEVCPITNRKAKWRDKWHKRWLELSEKFKESGND